MRPATKVQIDSSSNSVSVNDGQQDQINVIFNEPETLRLFVAYSNKFLAKIFSKNMTKQSKDLSKSQWYKKWHVNFKGEEGFGLRRGE